MADINNRLVEFDTGYKMMGQYDLDGFPKDITSLGDDLYVSIRRGVEWYIYKCQLDGGLSVMRRIKAPEGTCGLAVSDDGRIVVGTRNGDVRVLSQSGESVFIVKKSGYNHVAMSRCKPVMFYHSDGDAIVCRSLQDGKQQYTYCQDNMKRLRAICFGDKGVIYVCSSTFRNVHQISQDCQQGRVILDTLHGIIKPEAILYNPHTNECVVTSRGEDTVMEVYKLK